MPEGRARPQRTCLGCRGVFDQAHLVRYVRAPDGQVLVDLREKLPGRGGYTCFDPACIRQAVARRQFDRAFRAPCLPAPVDELVGMLADELHKRLDALLGMARKSSQVISGGTLVLDALDRPRDLAVIVCADDISAGVFEKIARKAAGHAVPCFRYSTKAALGQLLGRGERSVTALTKGRLAEAFLAEWQKSKVISGEI